jgi:hypothetical protein
MALNRGAFIIQKVFRRHWICFKSDWSGHLVRKSIFKGMEIVPFFKFHFPNNELFGLHLIVTRIGFVFIGSDLNSILYTCPIFRIALDSPTILVPPI